MLLRLVLPFLATLTCLFVFATVSMQLMSSMRAYAGGESLWSKAQKDAVYSLHRFAATKNPADFERYRAAISVPLGDRRARLELEKEEPDYDAARAGFLQGRNDAEDIDGMIRLFRRLRHFDPVDRAIAIWAAADETIAQMIATADRLRTAVEDDSADPEQIDALLYEIDRASAVLAPLDDAFSYTLGDASRRMTRTLVGLMALATAVLTTFVVLFARALLQERESYQQALYESEERYRAFFETSIDAVLLAREDGSVATVNPAACIVFGCSEFEFRDAGADWMNGETLDSLRLAIREGARTGRFRASLPFRRKNGASFVGEVSSARFADPSGEARISVVVRDVSERVRAEQEIRRLNASLEERVAARTAELETANRELALNNRELEAFCYAVSHDLRLPLRAMNGFSELLLDEYETVLDARAKDYLQRVRDACRRMGRLIDDLLGLTRYTRQKLVPTDVDLGAVARSVVDELRAEHPDREVEVTIAPDLVATVHGDPSLIRVLLRSLLTNAWKYTAAVEHPLVEIGVRSEAGEKVYFVRDNGCGFDMAYADQLFRVFNRLHAVDEFGGTGIGLAIVQRIVLRHGGRVWAESQPRLGATFCFTLGAAARDATSADTAPELRRAVG